MTVGPTDFLLISSDDMLASHLAARIITSTNEGRLLFLVPNSERDSTPPQELLTHLSALIHRHDQSMRNEETDARVHIAYAGPEEIRLELAKIHWAPMSQIWFLPGNGTSIEAVAALLNTVLAALPDTVKFDLNCVIDDRRSMRAKLRQACEENSTICRTFTTAFVLGDGPAENSHHAFPQFLDLLFAFKKEIEERLPEYFEFRSLRCLAPSQPDFNLISAEQAADLMVRISRQQETTSGSYDIAALERTSFADFCAGVSMAYGFGFNIVQDPNALNAVDTAFHERLGHFYECCDSLQDFDPMAANLAAGITNPAQMEDQEMLRILKIKKEAQENRRAARDQRVSNLSTMLTARTIERDGSKLTYFAGGSHGEHFAVLNALGQGLAYWGRLLDIMLCRHRFIIWEPRGTFSGPQPFGVREQIEDLQAILQKEAIHTCHLVGWCTGPKVALEFYFQQPQSVASMIFLNGIFKSTHTPPEMDSAYLKNLKSLCYAMDKAPKLASSVIKSLSDVPEPDTTELMNADSEQCAVQVLGLINQNLKHDVVAPFRSEAAAINYSRQLLDLWTFDQAPKLGQVEVPVLLLSTEHDQIASPAMVRSTAELLPHAYLIHVNGATHYCLYDRPEFVAECIEMFCKDPHLLDQSRIERQLSEQTAD